MNQKNNSLLGSYKTSVGEIVGSKNQTLITLINNSVEFIVKCEELTTCKESLELSLACNNLKCVRTGLFSIFKTNRSYLAISRSREDMSYVRVYNTEFVQSHNPVFPPFKISGQTLCNGDI